MRTHRGIFSAIATASLFVAACQGGRSLNPVGAAGAGGQTHPPSGGAGSGDRDAGDQGGGHSGTDAGQVPDAGGTTACTPLGAIPRRLWRLSDEQWGNAVQSLLNLPAAPVLTSRGGEAQYALFADASLGVDIDMLYDIY